MPVADATPPPHILRDRDKIHKFTYQIEKIRTLFVVSSECVFSLYFYFVDDEQIERKAAKSNNRPTNNRCRIPIDDKIYFYIFLKVEVKLAVPSIVYWYRTYTYAIH